MNSIIQHIGLVLQSSLADFLFEKIGSDNITHAAIKGYISDWLQQNDVCDSSEPKKKSSVKKRTPEIRPTCLDIVDKTDFTNKTELMKLTLSNLKDIARKNNCAITGTKASLVERIMSTKNPVVEEKTKPPKSKSKSTKTSDKAVDKVVPTNTLELVTNEFGQKVHLETKLVFNEDNKACGFLQQTSQHVDEMTGIIRPLNKEKMKLCKSLNIEFEAPNDISDDSDSDFSLSDDDDI